MSISPDWVNNALLIVSGLLQLVGLFGLLLVFFPGLTVVWVGQLVWAIYSGFNQSHEPWQYKLTIAIFVVNTLLMIGGSFIDNVLMAGKARQKGAPWWEIGLSWVAMIVGGIFLTPIGGLAAALLTIFLAEYFRLSKDKDQAFESLKSMAMGWGWAAVIRLILAVVMILLWVAVVVWL
ncbi:MAG: DUF456 domain-containing protein [Anaerolineaceae bacterium]